MRGHATILLPMLLGGMGLLSSACSSTVSAPAHEAEDLRGQAAAKSNEKTKMMIKVGSESFTATHEHNAVNNDLKSRLPMRLKMADLHANEKYADLRKPLPTNAKQPGTIRAGDLLLYGDKTLVLFYKTFRSSYSYTRLGRIDDASGLATAVGAGSVDIVLEAITKAEE